MRAATHALTCSRGRGMLGRMIMSLRRRVLSIMCGGMLLLRRGLLLLVVLLLLLLLLQFEVSAVRAALLLLLLEDFIVEPLTIVLDCQFCVVVNGDTDYTVTVKLVLWVVELHHIWVPKSLLRRGPLVWIELHAYPKQVQCLDRKSVV